MTRSLGSALAFSLLAHGGAVAAVGVLGVAWLGGASPAPAPLFVDLVQPLVAVNDRIALGDVPAPRIRPERASPVPSPGPAAAMPRADFHVPAPPDIAVPSASGPTLRPPDGPVPTLLEVERPPVVPLAPEPRSGPAEPAAGPVAGLPAGSVREPSAAPPAPILAVAESQRGGAAAGVAAPALPPSPLPPASSGEAAPTRSALARPPASPDGPPGEPATSRATRDGDRAPAIASGAPPAGAGAAGDGRAPDQGDVARFVPAEAQSGGHRDGDLGGGAIPPEYESYLRTLRQRVQDRLVYPWMAVRRGQRGTVELEVRLGADGRLIGVEVVAGPSVDALRAAAVTAVRGAAPFPFPPGVAGRALIVRLPVEFRLR